VTKLGENVTQTKAKKHLSIVIERLRCCAKAKENDNGSERRDVVDVHLNKSNQLRCCEGNEVAVERIGAVVDKVIVVRIVPVLEAINDVEDEEGRDDGHNNDQDAERHKV